MTAPGAHYALEIASGQVQMLLDSLRGSWTARYAIEDRPAGPEREHALAVHAIAHNQILDGLNKAVGGQAGLITHLAEHLADTWSDELGGN